MSSCVQINTSTYFIYKCTNYVHIIMLIYIADMHTNQVSKCSAVLFYVVRFVLCSGYCIMYMVRFALCSDFCIV